MRVDPLADLMAEEARLRVIADRIATLLADPERQRFASQIDRLLSDIKLSEVTYKSLLMDLNRVQSGALVNEQGPVAAANLRNAIKYGQTRLAIWPIIAEVIARQMLPVDAPLVTVKSRQVMGREAGAVNNLMRALSVLSNPQAASQAAVGPNHF